MLGTEAGVSRGQTPKGAGPYAHIPFKLDTLHSELLLHHSLLNCVAHEFGVVLESEFLQDTGTVRTDCSDS